MGSEGSGGDGWIEWRKYIILEIQRLSGNQDKLEGKVSKFELKTSVELSRLKVWAAVYGAAAGMIGMIIGVVLREVINRW